MGHSLHTRSPFYRVINVCVLVCDLNQVIHNLLSGWDFRLSWVVGDL